VDAIWNSPACAVVVLLRRRGRANAIVVVLVSSWSCLRRRGRAGVDQLSASRRSQHIESGVSAHPPMC